MAKAVIMPKAGITVESCIIGKWLKNVGDKVGAGASIALLGGGNSDSGSCLVFELWHDGTPVDPVIYMNY